MPSSSLAQTTPPQTGAALTPTTTGAAQSALQDSLQDPLTTTPPQGGAQGGGGGGDSPGQKLSWRQALGEFLGDKLYEGLAPALSEESLKKYANDAWNTAVGKLGDWIKAQANTPDETALAGKLTEELQKALKDQAGKLVNFNLKGVAEGVADFARKNPELVILAALAGAAAFIATNQDIPALKQTLGLGKAGKLNVGAKFTGGFLDLFKSIDKTIKELKLSYEVKGFEIGVEYKKEDGNRDIKGETSYTKKDSYKNDQGKDVEFDRLKIQGNGGVRMDEQGDVKGYKYGGAFNYNAGDKGQYKFNGMANHQYSVMPNGMKSTQTEAKLGFATGPWSTGLGFDQKTGPGGTSNNLGFSGNYTTPNFKLGTDLGLHTGPQGNYGTAKLDGMYKNGGFNATGSAMFGTDGRYDLNGKLKYDAGGPWSGFVGAGASHLPGQNGGFDNKYKFDAGLEYKKGNNFFKAGAGYENTNGQGSPTFNIGAGFNF